MIISTHGCALQYMGVAVAESVRSYLEAVVNGIYLATTDDCRPIYKTCYHRNSMPSEPDYCVLGSTNTWGPWEQFSVVQTIKSNS